MPRSGLLFTLNTVTEKADRRPAFRKIIRRPRLRLRSRRGSLGLQRSLKLPCWWEYPTPLSALRVSGSQTLDPLLARCPTPSAVWVAEAQQDRGHQHELYINWAHRCNRPMGLVGRVPSNFGQRGYQLYLIPSKFCDWLSFSLGNMGSLQRFPKPPSWN